MTDQELYDDIYRRCNLLCDHAGVNDITFDDVKVVRGGTRVEVCLLSSPRPIAASYWVSSTTVYDSNAPAAEQVTGQLIERVIPVLQRYMVLDDLADV